MVDYNTASDGEIEVSVALADPAGHVQYRVVQREDDRWYSTPFQAADVRSADQALKKVDLWLASSFQN